MMKNIKKKKGFTLIELIIVISIIAVLAAIAVPKYASIQKDAKVKADIATAKTIADAVTVLVAQEKISEQIGTAGTPTVVGSNGTITTAAADPTGFMTIDDAVDTDDAGQIGSYLQSIPKSETYKGEFFKVVVTNGNAIIYVKNMEVYPTTDAVYGE